MLSAGLSLGVRLGFLPAFKAWRSLVYRRSLVLSVLIAFAPSCSLFGNKEDAKKEPPVVAPRLPVEVVAPEQLATTLPQSFEGWSVEFPPGSINEKGNDRISQVSAKYFREVEGKHSFISIEVVDGTHAPAVNASLAIMSHAADDVHRSNLTVSGYHGIQHWQPESRSVTAMLVMAGRFLVRLKGDNVTVEDVTRLLQAIDARKLEEFADVRVRRVDVNDVSGPSGVP